MLRTKRLIAAAMFAGLLAACSPPPQQTQAPAEEAPVETASTPTLVVQSPSSGRAGHKPACGRRFGAWRLVL